MTTQTQSRQIMGSDFFENWERASIDQRNGLPQPARQKPVSPGSQLIDLPTPDSFSFNEVSVLEAINNRYSRRDYSPEPLSLSELAFLCWATQGVRSYDPEANRLRRTVPSAGARHPFETYLAVLKVESLEAGLYRYLSLEHKLCKLRLDPAIGEKMVSMCADFACNSAVTFIWTAIPYRTEWRYGLITPKFILLDAGHVCQNLYLAVEAIGAGTCAVGGYEQKNMDVFLGVDGQNEFTVYCAPVGKV